MSSTPRRVRYTAWAWFKRIAAWTLFICIAVGLVNAAIADLDLLHSLRANGRRIDATVIDRQVISGKTPTYHVDYSYQVNEATYYDTSISATKDEYDRDTIGSHITVTYLPSAPSTHRVGIVGKERVDSVSMNWRIGIAAFCAIGGLLVLAIEINLRKRMYLMRHGTATPGRITDMKVAQRAKSTSYLVSYSYHADQQPISETDDVSFF